MRYLMQVSVLLSFATMATLISSCEFTDTTHAIVPSYLCIDSFTFITDTNAATYQGKNSQQFVDMWVNESGNTIGATGIPVLLPIQKTGVRKISVDAGVAKSAQDDQRIPYPFIATYYTNVNLVPKGIDTIRPIFKYLPNTNFRLVVDYDDNAHSGGLFTLNHDYVFGADSMVKMIDNGSKEPNNPYMKIVADAASTSFQIRTKDAFVLPGLGAPVYLEMDYKSDVQLDVGYYYQEPNQPVNPATPVVSLYPTTEWKKVYLNLTEEIGGKRTGTQYAIYIGFFNYSGVKPNVALDNIKLLSLD